jgi:hypothetical protein
MGVHQDPDTYIAIKRILGIPDDEPIFILRAQDKFSTKTIWYYRNLNRDGVRDCSPNWLEWAESVGRITRNFLDWQMINRDKVKMPD